MIVAVKTHTKIDSGCENTLRLTVAVKTLTKNDSGCENATTDSGYMKTHPKIDRVCMQKSSAEIDCRCENIR